MFFQVHRLVLVESTALFDTAGIDLKPHKAVKIKSRGKHKSSYGYLFTHIIFFSHFSDFFLYFCVQKVVCLVFLSSLYWIRTRSGFLGPKCHSYCKRWDERPSFDWIKCSPSGILRWITVFCCPSQLISHIEEQGLDTEGLLRIPGAATRVKVDCCHYKHGYRHFIEVDIHILL